MHRVEAPLDAEDATLIRRVFESYAYVTELVEDKNTSIRRLRELLFGKPTEKTAAVLGRQADKPEPIACRWRCGSNGLAQRRSDER